MGKVVTSPMTINVEPSDGSLEQARREKMELETEVAANTEDRTQEQHDATIVQMERDSREQQNGTAGKSFNLKQYADQWLKTHGKRERALAVEFEQFLNQQAAVAARNYEKLGEEMLKTPPEKIAEKILPNEKKWTKDLKDGCIS